MYEDSKWNIDRGLEAVWLNVTIRSQSTSLGCLYRPPDSTTVFDALYSLFNKVWVKRKNVILLGDFNSNMPSDNDQELSQAGKKLQRILSSFRYSNVIKHPTRVTENSKSLIDLIIVSPNLHTSHTMAGSIDLDISDRDLMYAVFSVIRSKPKPKIISVKNHKSPDVYKLKEDLDKAPWHIISAVEDIEDSVYSWENMFKDILGNHIKCRKAKVRFQCPSH